MSQLRDIAHEYARKHGLLRSGDRLLVAVSGGPDSVALVQVLNELKDDLQLHLEVAHLQHGIRGDAARQDARFVEKLAEELKLPFHLREVDLPRLRSAAGKGNIEALARAERYRFFAELAASRNLSKVATAHTQDDQAETVLMWFLRGAGLRGLGGMAPIQKSDIPSEESLSITVIRPFLGISKTEIFRYLSARNIAYHTDETNQDTTYLRNWIRLTLLPKIRARAGDGFSTRVSQQAGLVRDEDALLESMTAETYRSVLAGGDLLRTALLKQPKALQRRILRYWIEQARGHLRGIDFIHIEALLRLTEEGPAQAKLSIPGGWEFIREYDLLRLGKNSRGAPRVCYSYELRIGTPLRVAEAGLELYAELLPARDARLPADLTEALFDSCCLTEPLLVRNFRQGDRFKPLGVSGHKKLKDLFIENKIPLSIRATLPLLVMGQEILWIPGYGRSQTALVSDKTDRVVHIKSFVYKDLTRDTL
ncbi:MAG TPA: tRNA lysidine(34) synthetase TilS [Candidatus Binatia bacterium]